MIAPPRRSVMTLAAYAAAEEASPTKHEWLRGEVFDLAGEPPEHSALALAAGSELRAALKGKPCRVFSADLKVFIAETQLATYPDLSVVCGKVETAADDANAVTNPVLIVEVLSDSTEAYDRGEKFAHYRRLPSLREYLLISQRTTRIEVYRRIEERGRWELEEAGPGEALALTALGCELSVDAVYFNPLAPAAGAP